MMKASELAAKALDIARNYLTVYVWGAVGSPVTEQTISDKVKQYPSNRTSGHEARARAVIGKNAWMFDCVNLLKAILWGWKGDASKYYGGATYCSNGVPDINADTMFARCTQQSADFSNIQVGEALWMSGHIGVYVGDGLGVECTPAFKGGTQITAVGNIAPKAGYNTRRWTKHGKLPYVTYDGSAAPSSQKNGKIVVNGKECPINLILRNGTNYVSEADLFEILGLDIKEIDTINNAGAPFAKIRDIAKVAGWKVSSRGNVAVIDTK